MEKRLILAIVLSFLVLALYQMVFMKNKPRTEPQVQTQAPVQQASPQPKTAEPSAPPAAAPSAPQAYDEAEAQAEQQVLVDTSLYQSVWSNRGGSLRSWRLKAHLDENKEGLELVSRRAAEVGRFPFSVETQDADLDKTANGGLFIPSATRLELRDGQTGQLIPMGIV
jgi:YidC/Oxa1 family membrane protein insertase